MSIEFSKIYGKYIENAKKYNYNVCVIGKSSEENGCSEIPERL